MTKQQLLDFFYRQCALQRNLTNCELAGLQASTPNVQASAQKLKDTASKQWDLALYIITQLEKPPFSNINIRELQQAIVRYQDTYAQQENDFSKLYNLGYIASEQGIVQFEVFPPDTETTIKKAYYLDLKTIHRTWSADDLELIKATQKSTWKAVSSPLRHSVEPKNEVKTANANQFFTHNSSKQSAMKHQPNEVAASRFVTHDLSLLRSHHHEIRHDKHAALQFHHSRTALHTTRFERAYPSYKIKQFPKHTELHDDTLPPTAKFLKHTKAQTNQPRQNKEQRKARWEDFSIMDYENTPKHEVLPQQKELLMQQEKDALKKQYRELLAINKKLQTELLTRFAEPKQSVQALPQSSICLKHRVLSWQIRCENLIVQNEALQHKLEGLDKTKEFEHQLLNISLYEEDEQNTDEESIITGITYSK